jgi:RES domain
MTSPPEILFRWKGTARLVPSRFPVVGLFDAVAAPADLEAIFELEGWTNDRISAELGILQAVPRDEWVVGQPMASVIMAAYCHPRPGGGRFSRDDRGAWYAARTIDTALSESIYHRSRELAEIGVLEARMQMRVYLSEFSTRFHDIRGADTPVALYDPDDYSASQRFARQLLGAGSHGVVYRSVRHPGGECVACFRPRLVKNVRIGGHYEYQWEGSPRPAVRKL